MHAAGEQGRPGRPRSRARPASRRALGGLSYKTGDNLYRLLCVAGTFLRCRGERATEGALDSGRRLVEATLLREARSLGDTGMHLVFHGSAPLDVRKI